MRDWHILSNGVLTYTSDSRFSVLHREGSYDWILQIKFVQERDAGVYECQVRTVINRQVHYGSGNQVSRKLLEMKRRS